MKNSRLANSILALAIFGAAGLPVAVAQDSTPRTPRTATDEALRKDAKERAHMGGSWFTPWSKIDGRDIHNYNDPGQELGEIQDAVLDRSSGRVLFVVVDTTDDMGLSGNTVLIPFRDLRWDAGREKVLLDPAADRSKTWASYSPKAWKAIRDPDADGATRGDDQSRALGDVLSRRADMESNDPYAQRFTGERKPYMIEGTITGVDRRVYPGSGEYTVVTVRTADGKTEKVTLGPSWYTTGDDWYPTRGSKVSVNAMRAGEGDQAEPVAMTTTINGKPRTFRNAEGSPAWVDSKRTASHVVRSRYVLGSEIAGKDVEARGERCGEVQDLIVECTSGEVAFLSIDPDKNFLGMADTKRLIPWSIASLRADGKVGIDASKEMVVASTPTPDKFDQAGQNEMLRQVYGAFEVPPMDFERRWRDGDTDRDRVRTDRSERRDMWANDGDIYKAARGGEVVSFSGRVVSVNQGREPWSDGEAMVIAVRNGNDTREFLVGPAAGDRVRTIKAGDQVTVEGWNTKAKGNQVMIARTLTHDGKTVTFWSEEKK